MNTQSRYIGALSAVAFLASVGLAQAEGPTAQPGSSGAGAGPAAAGAPPSKGLVIERIAPQDIQTLMNTTAPLALPQLPALPTEARQPIDPFVTNAGPAPQSMAGRKGPVSQAPTGEPSITPSEVTEGVITPFDYGRTSLNTVYHYTDRLLDTELSDDFPYRTVGWLRFVASNGLSYRCTAQLISNSIGVTAGHCVHDGGNGAAGWIRSGTFIPAYQNGAAPYGSAPVARVSTTSGWFNVGSLDAGYDIGVFVLGKRTGTTREIGSYTGYSSFCYSNCLQRYWYLTQLGYPGNYYNGQYMTQGEHLEVSDTRDYVYGSGMQGGSSGGGHFANLGDLGTYSAGSLGQWPTRNVIFATTSWGYTDATLKIQGGSSLSGPSNTNNFRLIYNNACTFARGLHGAASCVLLP